MSLRTPDNILKNEIRTRNINISEASMGGEKCSGATTAKKRPRGGEKGHISPITFGGKREASETRRGRRSLKGGEQIILQKNIAGELLQEETRDLAGN